MDPSEDPDAEMASSEVSYEESDDDACKLHTIHLDPDGDLALLVEPPIELTGERVFRDRANYLELHWPHQREKFHFLFIVDARTMSRVSPVFRDLLDDCIDGVSLHSKAQQRRLSNDDDIPTLPLDPTDCPAALNVILHLLHSVELPTYATHLEPDLLGDILYLADKYEVVSTMRLNIAWWWNDAIKTAQHHSMNDEGSPDDAKESEWMRCGRRGWRHPFRELVGLTYCAWMLGAPHAYEKGIRSLAWRCALTAEGNLIDGFHYDDYRKEQIELLSFRQATSSDIYDDVLAVRNDWLTRPIRMVKELIDKLKESTSGKPNAKCVCKGKREKRKCDGLLLEILENFMKDPLMGASLHSGPGIDRRAIYDIYPREYHTWGVNVKVRRVWQYDLPKRVKQPSFHNHCNTLFDRDFGPRCWRDPFEVEGGIRSTFTWEDTHEPGWDYNVSVFGTRRGLTWRAAGKGLLPDGQFREDHRNLYHTYGPSTVIELDIDRLSSRQLVRRTVHWEPRHPGDTKQKARLTNKAMFGLWAYNLISKYEYEYIG